MKYIAAYALLVLGGKENPTAADVEKVCKEAGIKPDSDKIKSLIEKMSGKRFDECAEAGLKKMASMGTAAPAGGAAAGPSAGAAEAKKEEAPKEEEEDVNMGGLFGDDDDDY